MKRVQRGGPWTGSTGVVHGPGVHVLYTSSVKCDLVEQLPATLCSPDGSYPIQFSFYTPGLV